MKALFKNLLPEKIIGRLDHIRRPEMRSNFGGPFNGQRFRQRIFFDLLYALPIQVLIETGAYYGATTALFLATSLPVHSVELNPRSWAYTKLRFWLERENLRLHEGDSRAFLRTLASDPKISGLTPFVYLDAHWEDDLPLRDEVDIIFKAWADPVVMIDDFQVPNESYNFDSYGPDKTLSLSYLAQVMDAHDLVPLFPAVPASSETGLKRGCVVLLRRKTSLGVLQNCPTLRQPAPAA